jgi:hypothetical protein
MYGISERLPAQNTGGLYKTQRQHSRDFVDAFPSRAFRDGKGRFPAKLK